MTISRTNLRFAVLFGLVLPATAALGQYTGTSHPDEVPISTANDGVRQPIVYTGTPQPQAIPAGVPQGYIPTPAARPAALPAATVTTYVPATELKVRELPGASTSATDGMVVGDPLPASAPAAVSAEFPSDIDAHIVTRVDGPANAVPVGTLVKTRLLDELSTKSTEEGAEWHAELTESLYRDGRVLIPAGSVVRGKVTEVVGGRRINGEAAIHLTPIAVTLPDGSVRGLHAQVIDTSLYHQTKVDSEGTILHKTNRKMETGVLALTTGSGAAAGAIIAGVPGALVGAGVGAGVSVALYLKQDHQTYLPRETQITFELTRAIQVGNE